MSVTDLVTETVERLVAEVQRARAKHPAQSSAHGAWAVIAEELDELWDLVKVDQANGRRARSEALQIAATALRFYIEHTEEGKP